MRAGIAVTLSLLLAAVTAGAAAGQERSLPEALRPGGLVRVETAAGGSVRGRLDRVEPEALVLVPTQDGSSGQIRVPVAEIAAVWVRERSTGRGARIGLIGGALGGAALGVLGGLVVAGVCEYDCPDNTATFVVGTTALGALGGAGSGALLGAVVGAAIPRWVRRWP